MATIQDAVLRNVDRINSGGQSGTSLPANTIRAGVESNPGIPIPQSNFPVRGSYPPDLVTGQDFEGASQNDMSPVRFMRSRVFAPRNPITIVKNKNSSSASQGAAQPVKVAGTPKQVINLSVSEVPRKLNGQMVALVTAQWNPAPGDAFYGFVQIWAQNYHGVTLPQLVASGSSPLTFSMDATNETVTIIAVSVSPSGVRSQLLGSPAALVVLSPTSGAPPAPTVTQNLVATPVGYQFQFAQEAGLLTNLVDGYNIYRNTSNTFGSATKIAYVKQAAVNSGTYTFQDSNVPNGTNYFYWVSAVDVNGEESAATAAQSGTVVNTSIYTASSNLTSGTKLGGDGGLSAVGASGGLDLAGGTPTAGKISAGNGLVADTSGNLQLKNIAGAAGSSNNPTTASTTYVTIPEMTTTITTKGNKVLITFWVVIDPGGVGGDNTFVALFRDGVQLTADAFLEGSASNLFYMAALVFVDSPSAASHTFDARWKVTSGNVAQANGTSRQFQAVELG